MAQKSKLPYLIREALESGKWEPVEVGGQIETYTRGTEIVKIGTNALRGTSPASYVYEVHDPEEDFRTTHMLVMNLLCLRLAKSSKMSSWFDTVSTTTE